MGKFDLEIIGLNTIVSSKRSKKEINYLDGQKRKPRRGTFNPNEESANTYLWVSSLVTNDDVSREENSLVIDDVSSEENSLVIKDDVSSEGNSFLIDDDFQSQENEESSLTDHCVNSLTINESLTTMIF